MAGSEAIGQAIERVIASFGNDGSDEDQIFVQPMLDARGDGRSGLLAQPSGGGPYFIINYDDRSGRTERVTAGAGGNLETFYCLKSRRDACPPSLRRSSR